MKNENTQQSRNREIAQQKTTKRAGDGVVLCAVPGFERMFTIQVVYRISQ